MMTFERLFCQHCCSQCETQLNITHNMTYGMHSTTYFDFVLLLSQNQLFLKKGIKITGCGCLVSNQPYIRYCAVCNLWISYIW